MRISDWSSDVCSSDLDPIAALEAHTRTAPDSAAAWQALGEARFDLADYRDAVAAYEKAAALAPQNAGLWSALGEVRTYVDQRDPMPPAAPAAFAKANAPDPREPRAPPFNRKSAG